MHEATVLITGIGSTTGISVLKGLRKQRVIKIKIVGVDTNKAHEIAGSTLCDVFYTVPPAKNNKYISTLLHICKQHKAQMIFPINDIELTVLSTYKGAFKNIGVDVWVSESTIVNVCNNKYETYLHFKKAGVPTPRTYSLTEFQKTKIFRKSGYIIKPNEGVSSRGVHRIHNSKNMNIYLDSIKDPIIQEYIEGEEYTIDVCSDSRSRVRGVVVRKRIETRSGISYKGKSVRFPQLVKFAKNIASTLHFTGPCNIQCIVDKNKKVWFIEINPRFSAGLPLSIESGLNSPYILLRDSLRLKLKKWYDYKPNIFMTRYWEEIFYS